MCTRSVLCRHTNVLIWPPGESTGGDGLASAAEADEVPYTEGQRELAQSAALLRSVPLVSNCALRLRYELADTAGEDVQMAAGAREEVSLRQSERMSGAGGGGPGGGQQKGVSFDGDDARSVQRSLLIELSDVAVQLPLGSVHS